MKFDPVRISEQPEYDALCPEWKRHPAPAPREQLVLGTNRPSGTFRCGETVRFSVEYLSDGKPLPGKELLCRLERDFHAPETFSLISAESPVFYETTLEKPGFVRFSASSGTLTGAYGAGFDPLAIVPAPEIDGFEAFWNARKQELAAIPPQVLKLEKVPLADPKYEGTVECYDVQIACTDGTPVSGLLALPCGAKPGTLPAYCFFHGAGIRPSFQPLTWAAHGMLAFNVNAHGIPYGKTEEFYQKELKRLENYPARVYEKAEDSLFVHMTLRVLRALEYLKTRPEYDGGTLVLHGGSQGGYQCIAAAGLDHDVSLIVPNAPAMCNLAGALEGRTPSWPFTVKPEPEQLRNNRNALYCDGASFARHAKAQALFTVGFSDIAAVPSSVYAAYNAYAGEKQIVDFPECGHDGAVFWTAEAEILQFIRNNKPNHNQE